MCGIGGIARLSDKPFPHLDRFVSEMLNGLAERGTDATGYASMDDEGTVTYSKAACGAREFNTERKAVPSDFRSILLHTRFATQGSAAFMENNHPIKYENIWAVHNGHIYNDDVVFESNNLERNGKVDSEAIPALIHAVGWDNTLDSLKLLEGDMAVALFNQKLPRELILARANYSPLAVIRNRDFIVWASTYSAIKNAWAKTLGTPPAFDKFTYLQEGEAMIVSDGEIEMTTFEPGFSYYYYGGKSYIYDSRDYQGTSTSLVKINEKKFDDYHKQSFGDEGEDSEWDWDDDDLIFKRRKMDDPIIIEDDEEGQFMPLLTKDDYEAFNNEKCEDCSVWFPRWEMKTVKFMGINSRLCPECTRWAVEAGGDRYH